MRFEYTPETPVQTQDIALEESKRLGSTALVAAKRGLAVGLSAVAMSGTAALAEQSPEPPVNNANLPSCDWNYLAGRDSICAPGNIPAECAAPAASQIRHYRLQPRRLHHAIKTVRAKSAGEPYNPRPFEIMSQDDGAVIDNNQGRREAVLYLGRLMGATGWRMTVYLYKFNQLGYKAKVDAGVRAAENCGYDVQMTLACNNAHWEKAKFRHSVRAVAKRYTEEGVHRYAICNEPNYPGWLKRMKGRTLPRTYNELYQIGYREVKKQDEHNKVIWGDLSSSHRPLVFMHRALACHRPKDNCKPVKADEIGYHPYLWTKHLKLHNPHTKRTSWRVGIDSLQVVQKQIKFEHKYGRLQTPDGEKPKLSLDEFAQMVRAPHRVKRRNIPDRRRGKNYEKIGDYLCRRKNFRRISFYIIDKMPKWRRKFDVFDSGMVNARGRLDQTFYDIGAWANAHPDCVEK